MAAAREATAMGIANLAAHSALGTSLEDLSKAWKAEAVYTPKMNEQERANKLAQWNRALAAVRLYTSTGITSH